MDDAAAFLGLFSGAKAVYTGASTFTCPMIVVCHNRTPMLMRRFT